MNKVILFREHPSNSPANKNDKILSSASKLITTESQTDEVKRMHIQLIELKAQLKSKLEKYSNSIEEKIAKILRTDAIRKSVIDDKLSISGPKMVADKVEIRPERGSTVKNVVINTEIRMKRILTSIEKLKEIKKKAESELDKMQSSNRKRSAENKGRIPEWIGDTLNVDRLHAPTHDEFYTGI